MAYLSFDEYKQMGYTKISDEDAFKKIESNTEPLFDVVTHFYYVDNDIQQDTDSTRVKFFKRALALHCDFAQESGASTPYELTQQQISSVSVGRTRIEQSGTVSNVTSGKSGIYTVAMRYLARTGLLFKGVGWL